MGLFNFSIYLLVKNNGFLLNDRMFSSKFLYTRWNKDEPFSDTVAAFFRIYDHFINGVALENPFEFYLNAIYDYGPFAALRQTMEAQRMPFILC
jgi:hypothetical protein